MLFSLRWLFIGLFVTVMFQSCKKDDNLGLDIINLPGDRFGFDYVDTTTLIAWSIFEDSIQTSGVLYNLLGSYYDNVFGKTSASIYTQALLSTNNVSFGNNPVGDSLVLTLRYNGYYGDSLFKHRLKIYEIDGNADFHKDTLYYSNSDLPLGQLLFDEEVTFNPVDSVDFDGERVPAILKVKLNQILINKFITASGTSDLANNDNFGNFFKGLHITVEGVNTPGQGSIAYFNMNADLTKLTLYYNNDIDTLSYPFVINDQCAKFTNFYHNGYQEAEYQLKNQDSTGVNDRLYLQATAGVKIMLKMPHLKELYKEGPVAINRAELVLKTDPSDHTAADFKVPVKLTLARINDEGKYTFVTDYLYSEAFFGGQHDPVRNEYRFRITRHVQEILNEKFEDNGLVVLVSGSAILANRVAVLGNSTSAGRNVRLEIVFAKP